MGEDCRFPLLTHKFKDQGNKGETIAQADTGKKGGRKKGNGEATRDTNLPTKFFFSLSSHFLKSTARQRAEKKIPIYFTPDRVSQCIVFTSLIPQTNLVETINF